MASKLQSLQLVRIATQDRTELEAALGSPGLARLRPSMRLRKIDSGAYVYFEEQPAEHLWVVRSGEIRTLKTSASGRVTTLELVPPGGLFGMAAIIEDWHYTESAQALAASEVWSVRRRAVAAVLKERPDAGRALLGIIARRLQSAHDRLCSFATDSVSARLARTVLEEAEDGRVELTRRILGESAGTTVETTIRILRGFERAGWIEGGVGWVRILDRSSLEDAARGAKP